MNRNADPVAAASEDIPLQEQNMSLILERYSNEGTAHSAPPKGRSRCLLLSLRALCLALLSLILILFCIMLGNALRSDSNGIDRDTYFSSRNILLPSFSQFQLDLKKFQQTLSEAITFRTVSYGDERDANLTAKIEFGQFLEAAFPAVHKSPLVNRAIIGGASLLYEIRGENPDLKPYLLISHLDVVPAENEDEWDQDPFAGAIEGDFLFGRGTLDIKSSVIGILTALEMRITQDRNPERSIFLFFGHDEETGGHKGAHEAASYLQDRGVELEFILDEGAAVLRNFYPGVDKDVCIVGVAEKGFLTVQVEASGSAGHSSMPSEDTSIGNLAKALTALQENPLPYHFSSGDLNRETFEWLAPYFPFGTRLALTNIWLLKPAVLSVVTSSPETRALARTTTAFTVVSGGIKDNVLPKFSKALVNHRLHPNDDAESVLKWDRNVAERVQGVKVRVKPGWKNEPSPVSPHGQKDATYHVIKSSIHSVMPDALVVPYLTPGGTDSKHFVELTDRIYRFVPYILDKDRNDAKRIHGINERIAIGDLPNFVKFYWAVIELADRI